MPTFTYEGLDPSGAQRTGSVDADDRIGAMRSLKEQGIIPLDVVPAGATPIASRAKAPSGADVSRRKTVRRGKVRARDIMVFTHQLSSLVGAGLPLLSALRLVQAQTENQRLKEIVTQISHDVEGGDSFSEALAKHPKVFSTLYVSMIGVAETGGVLDRVLEQLSQFIERREEFKSNVLTAIVYPIFLICIAFLAVTFLMMFVVPVITGILMESGQELPAPTKLLMAISGFLRSWWWAILIVAFGVVTWLRKAWSTKEGKYKRDHLLMRMPILGQILEKSAIARFARTLATLTDSGVPILHSLQIMHETVGNAVIGSEIEHVADQVRKGAGLAEPLKESKVFPEMVSNLISIGEESGSLSEMLHRIADSFDFEVSNAVKRFTSVLEPLLIVMMAGVVGFIVIAMLLPILTITQGVGL